MPSPTAYPTDDCSACAGLGRLLGDEYHDDITCPECHGLAECPECRQMARPANEPACAACWARVGCVGCGERRGEYVTDEGMICAACADVVIRRGLERLGLLDMLSGSNKGASHARAR